ncbi:MAG: dienelactone hydrolase family protein, partial [Actinomadura sp.]
GGADPTVDADLPAMAAVEVVAGAGHGFYRRGHPGYDPAATAEAWRRTHRFLEKNSLHSVIDHQGISS